MKKRIRRYSELSGIETFLDRYHYLKLEGSVGQDTFGFDRYMNQQFYRSKEWKDIRSYVILRDLACDLGIEGRDIPYGIIIHHMNPIDPDDIKFSTKYLLDPEYLITCSDRTHHAIHYGDESLLLSNEVIARTPNDTCPWR